HFGRAPGGTHPGGAIFRCAVFFGAGNGFQVSPVTVPAFNNNKNGNNKSIMARPLRIEYPNAYYHVTNRGEGRRAIFPNEEYFEVFLSGLSDACRRLNVEVHGYCLLKNEYHLLIKTPEGNLSRFMRQVDGLYTQNYQRLRRTRGAVFRSRYKAVLVQAEKYLLNLSRFLHCLPGRNRIKPETHPWSSYAHYCNKARPGDWLVRDEVLAQLGEGGRVHVRYASYVAEGADQE